jgi:nucleoside-diphosphate-sugar epimerase
LDHVVKVLLTGATGTIGSAVLKALLAEGDEVTALVRSPESAATVTALGATPLLGTMTDAELVATAAAASDGVIHVASPGDETSAATEATFVDAVLGALAGTSIPFVTTGGVWVFGNGADLTEQSPWNPPALTAWRGDVEARVRASNVHTTIIAPALVYGPGGTGIPSLLLPDADGNVRLVGDGHQHWSTVHVDDLADLYVLALKNAADDGYYLGSSGQCPTVLEVAEATAHGATIVPETIEESQGRFGVYFADALLLDQQASGAAARHDLGWAPHRPSLISELQTRV